MDMTEIGFRIGAYFIPFLFALCFHEYAHGLVAKWKGDRTAELTGRLTMNPLAHMDFLGTLVLPILSIVFASPIFFGWAKPVPIDYRNLKNLKVDLFWIALAGPLSNLFLAVVGAVLMGLSARFLMASSHIRAILSILDVFIATNLFLAVFNILPIHPLDGGKVIARFLPNRWNYFLEQNEGMLSIVLMMLIFSGALRFLALPVFWLHNELKMFALGGLI
ncbi:MAG TPA: site-2 protease family protein [Pseudobdellovibrionaceae bacterium]|nr:site-2 protease family protein [Pseudobdellovibrionaceae bacterium]